MPASDALAAIAACSATALSCPIVLISACDGARHRVVAAHGLAIGDADPPAPSFCRLALQADAAFEIDDASRDARLADDVMVAGPPRVRFCAGLALRRDPDQPALGTLCVLDTRPRRLTSRDAALLKSFGGALAELLHERRRGPEIERERRRLLDFARSSGDWLWETDAALRYTWIAGAFEAVTGLPAAAKIGQRVDDMPQLDARGLPGHATFHELLRDGLPFSRVLTEKTTLRGPRVISRSAVPVLDERGQLLGWRGTARDVTEPVASTQLQRSQDELLKQLCDQAPGVIFQLCSATDGGWRFEFVNARVADLFELTPAELLADAASFEARVHPDDRLRLRAAFPHDAHAAGVPGLEYRVVLPSGRERWLSATASPEARADGSVVWRGFIADITERQRIALALHASEARWEIAAETNGIGIAQLDLESGRLTFDARACKNHGIVYPHPPYLLADWVAAIHPDDQPAAAAALRAAVEETGRLDARYRFRRPDGSEPWLEVIARVDQRRGGAPASLIGTCRDVTEQVAVDALRRDKETVERASRAKSEFLSRVSHELRTPLNGILGFAQLMALDRDDPLTGEQRLRLSGVERSGEHLLALINDVLEISRIEQEDFEPQLGAVDLVGATKTCLTMVQPLAAARDVVPAWRLPPACWVTADTRALEQILINLLSNAIKFNRPGGQVLIEAERRDGKVALSVQDEGAGLSEAQLAQLFQPFNRLGAERRRIEGNGLGLVISRQLVRGMHGDLTVQSRAGSGCRFTLVLPEAQAPADRAAAPPAVRSDAPTGSGPRRHVLYIEDEPLNVLLMQEVFRRSAQWELHIARDGTEGLAMARSLLPDLLLIDINLPDTSGIAIVRELRSRPETAALHCIALSADAMREQIEIARTAGFDDYWTKPVDVANLIDNINRKAGP
jgi:PAS domain S-box-containing protein